MSYHYRFPRKIFVLQTVIARVRHIRKARIKCAKCGLTPCEGANLRKVGYKLFICKGGHNEKRVELPVQS